MTEFNILMKKNGLDNKQAARMFGVSIRTITRWKSGTSPTPTAVILVLKQRQAA